MNNLRAVFIRPDGRVRPIWSFLVAAVAIVASSYAAAYLTTAFRPATLNGFEALYRPLVAAFEFLAFAFMANAFDHSPQVKLELGFPRIDWAAFLSGNLAGALMICLAVAILLGFCGLRLSAIYEGRFPIGSSLIQLWIILAAALAEELAFRGYPFRRLIESVGRPWLAVVLAAPMFVSIHLLNPNVSKPAMLNTALISVLLALVYLRTGSLWAPWGLHFAWNYTLGVAFGLPVSGLNQFQTFVAGEVSQRDWLSGGFYGIEGGLAGTIAILAGFVLLPMLPKNPNASPTTGIQPLEAADMPAS